jgi:ribosome-binding protein aMBF1 (putative translation factor)
MLTKKTKRATRKIVVKKHAVAVVKKHKVVVKTKAAIVVARFGRYITRRRKKKGWAIRELARRAKTAHTNIFQFERQGKNPRLSELVALAQAFDQPLLKFLEPLG